MSTADNQNCRGIYQKIFLHFQANKEYNERIEVKGSDFNEHI